MTEHSRNVTDAEFMEAPLPSTDDLAVAAQSLGTMIAVGVPILECVFVTIGAAQNARLRWVLRQAAEMVRIGAGMAQPISTHPDILESEFIEAVRVGEADGNLDQTLLKYAHSKCETPNQLLARIIGRSDAVRTFTADMEELIAGGCSVTEALAVSAERAESPFRAVINQVRDAYQKGHSLAEAMALVEPPEFDRLYLNVIKAGECAAKPYSAFKVLALP